MTNNHPDVYITLKIPQTVQIIFIRCVICAQLCRISVIGVFSRSGIAPMVRFLYFSIHFSGILMNSSLCMRCISGSGGHLASNFSWSSTAILRRDLPNRTILHARLEGLTLTHAARKTGNTKLPVPKINNCPGPVEQPTPATQSGTLSP